MAVLNATGRALRLRMEAREDGEWTEERGRAALRDSLDFYHQQGMLISQLALDPDLRRTLGRKMAHAISRVPAWMEARVYGVQVISSRLFALGSVQLMAEHRSAIEQIVDAQVDDPEPIEAVLAENPVPAGTDEETAEELYEQMGGVFSAHLEAMAAIGRDIDEWVEEELAEEGEEE
jgi:hypothetical protein